LPKLFSSGKVAGMASYNSGLRGRRFSASSLERRRRSGGFSLVELLLVMLIGIVLICLSANRFNTAGRERSMAACRKNLQNIYLALSIYASDNKGRYPLVPGATTAEAPLSLLVPRSTTVTEMFVCPGSKEKALPEGEPFAKRKISYAYYMGRATNNGAEDIFASDRQVDLSIKRKGQRVFSKEEKPKSNHGNEGGNLLFCDGTVAGSGTKAPQDLLFPTNVVLLNPK
jgi:type II secretory pathway pseudopilin PulG